MMQTKATHWVLAHGKDCDGYNSGHIYPFDNFKEADDFANDLLSSSDGLIYAVTSSEDEMIEYCHHYGKDYKNYLFVYNSYNEDIEEKKEKKVYAITDIDDLEYDEKTNDDNFIDLAEKAGLVWSLDGFVNAFNNSEISDQWYIRIV